MPTLIFCIFPENEYNSTYVRCIQEVKLRLTSASNGGRIMESRSSHTLTVGANDNPHGTVEFTNTGYRLVEVVSENSTQYISISRR